MARSGDDGLEIETTLRYYCSHEESFAQIPYEWLGPAGRLLRDDPLYATDCEPLRRAAVFGVIAGDLADEDPSRIRQPPLIMGIENFHVDTGTTKPV